MDEKFGSLEQTLGQLTVDVSKLKGQRRHTSTTGRHWHHRVAARTTGRRDNSIDIDSRRCCLNFPGVREPIRDEYRVNTDVIVSAPTECSSSLSRETRNAVSASERSDQPRLLVLMGPSSGSCSDEKGSESRQSGPHDEGARSRSATGKEKASFKNGELQGEDKLHSSQRSQQERHSNN